MQFISCHNGKLQTLETAGLKTSPDRAFATGMEALDALAPQKMFARGAIHELLFERSHGEPKFVAAMIARGAAEFEEARRHGGTEARSEGQGGRERVNALLPAASSLTSCLRASVPPCLFPIVWSDPRGEVYPPALAALGMDLSKLYLLRTSSAADEAWTVTECLRCRGVGAVIATPRN